MTHKINSEWMAALSNEFNKSYFKTLMDFVENAYKTKEVFPPKDSVFNALNRPSLKEIKVVILGQDPYHNTNQAHGYAFSVPKNEKIPPSLANIYKELEADLGCPIPTHGNLLKWVDQGVLLLNTVLTVEAHQAYSHRKKGWEQFTDAIIQVLNNQSSPIVFLLWGKPAQEKSKMLNNPNHLILKAPHPSPLSVYRGFWGCQHFSKTNAFLESKGLDPIDWCIC